ncbi:MAG: 50S ribosomal protein L11 methyltransferase [Chitinophagaceae bacterium]
MNRYIEISVTASESEQEQLIGMLSVLNPTGFEQTDGVLLTYFKEAQFHMQEILDAMRGFVFTTRILEDQNWNEEWEKNFEPVLVGLFCGIRADFHKPIPNVKHEIIITPKMSFGTGHHDTTYMMVEQMNELNFNNKTVFDFGTGTGILAILACKLGARLIVASDNDEWSISNAAENLEKNGCDTIKLIESSSLPGDMYNIILANISKNVIMQNLSGLKTRLHQNGQLLLSGFLSEDEYDIVQDCAELGLVLEDCRHRGNWILLQFRN